MQARSTAVSHFDQNELQFWDTLMPVAGYINGLQALSSADQQKASLATLVTKASDAVTAAQAAKEEIDSIARAARDSSAEVGVARHGKLFAEEARRHQRSARFWLVATVLLAAFLSWFVKWQFDQSVTAPQGLTSLTVVQFALVRVFGFSALISAVLSCGRGYRAAAHNEIVNRHRQNALGSFETFVSASTDDQTKNALLMYAAQSIFAQQASGLVTADNDSNGSHHVLELVRAVGSPGKPSSP